MLATFKGFRCGFILLSLLLLTTNVCAISLGISPSVLEFKDVLKGGYAERKATISTSSPDPLEIGLTVGGSIKDWVTVEETTFILDPRARHAINVYAEPPADTPTGVYKGYIIASAKPKIAAEDVMGAIIVTAVEMQVNLIVTGTEIIKFEIPLLTVKDTEEGQPIEFNVRVDNGGNTRITPKIHIEVLSKEGSLLKSLDYSNTQVLPTTSELITIKVPNDLPIGEYSAKITVEVSDKTVEESLEFEVLERGSLRLQGQLITIKTNKVWTTVGEVVEIAAVFKNIGQLVAPAQFKGKVYIGENLVDVIEGDEIDVPVGDTKDLVAFYTPQKAGKYKIIGWVYYSKKTTDETFVILNVQEGEQAPTTTLPAEAEGSSNLYMVIGLLIVAVVFLVFYVVKSRRPY